MPKSQKTIAITGATGFIGRPLVKHLLKRPEVHIKAISRDGYDAEFMDSLTAKEQRRLSFHQADITNQSSLVGCFQGVHGVISLAGYREFWSEDKSNFYQVNEQGAANVFDECLSAGVEKSSTR